MIVYLAVIVTVAVTFLGAAALREKRRKLWRNFASEFGLQLIESKELYGLGSFSAIGTLGLFDAVIAEQYEGSDDNKTLYTKFTLSGDGMTRDLSIDRESAFSRLFGAADIRTGDPEFDKLMRIEGDAPVAAAVLGREARVALVEPHGILRADGGRVTLSWRGTPTGGQMRMALDRTRKLAEKYLLRESDIPRRILENFLAETDPGPKIWFFRTLVEQFSNSDEDREALAEAAKSHIPDLRYLAALHTSTKNLRLISEAASNPATALDIRKWAIARLRGFGPTEPVLATLFHLITREHPEPIRLDALGMIGDIGGRECVEKILPYTEGLLADPDVKSAARTAVAKIQSRLGPADAGRISVAEPTAGEGAISVASIPSGQGAIAEARYRKVEAVE